MGGRLLAAGGAVRDYALASLGRLKGPLPESADVDLVAFGVSFPELLEALEPWGLVRRILRREGGPEAPRTGLAALRRGRARLEFSLPKGAPPEPGEHFGPAALFRDAAGRDFTVNAVYYDPLEDRLLDPLGGLADLREGRLRLCSPRAFRDDPVRMLRAMSLLARRPFAAGGDVLAAAGRHAGLLPGAPPERSWREWRLLAESPRPHLGLTFLRDSGLLSAYPALDALRALPQYRHFHPEGSVWNHSVLAVQAMSRIAPQKGARRAVLSLAALLHDVGKTLAARSAQAKDGCPLVIYPDHAAKGVPVAREFLRSIGAPGAVVRAVTKLTARHMDLAFKAFEPAVLRRTARGLAPDADLADFWAIVASDWNGRSPWPEKFPLSLEEFLEPVGGKTGAAPDLVTGRDILEAFGIGAGPEVGRLLKLAREATDDGRVSSREQALACLAARLRGEEALG
ncbi:MAG: HD domain-containing protein [Deltaproteobacteria bacterium]|jgi:tRNA nucleotidyltransferase (CCA-adding enzyme)|nr:HD domain-containing protein [Deltaproteobacteria bacterium]